MCVCVCVREKCEYAFSVSTRRCVVRAQAWYFEAQLTGVMYGDVSSIVALLPRCVEPSMVATDCTYTVVVYCSVVRVGRRTEKGVARTCCKGERRGRGREGGTGAERRTTGRPEGWTGRFARALLGGSSHLLLLALGPWLSASPYCNVSLKQSPPRQLGPPSRPQCTT